MAKQSETTMAKGNEGRRREAASLGSGRHEFWKGSRQEVAIFSQS